MTSEADIIRAAIHHDAGAWWETYGKIYPKDRSKGVIKPKMNYLQRKIQAVNRKMEDDRLPVRLIGLKPRQKGSTTFFSAIDYHAMRRRPVAACVIGGQYSQTKEVWDMLDTYEKNDAFQWKNRGEINAKEGRFSNGSKIKPETAGDKLAGIAGTLQVLHCTEVARWTSYGVANAGEVLNNILKCVPRLPETLICLESTAEGQTGAFYERWLTAVNAEDFLNGTKEVGPGEYVRIFAPWFEFEDSAMRLNPDQKRVIESSIDSEDEFAGERELMILYQNESPQGIQRLGTTVEGFDLWEQLAWRRWAIRNECKRDKNIFDRDYPHSWQTAFQKSGNPRFNGTGLSVLRKRARVVVPIYGLIEQGQERVSFRQTEDREAKMIMYERPAIGRKYILSVDPMTGITQTAGTDPDRHGVYVLRQGYFDEWGKWQRVRAVAGLVPCRWDIDVLAEQVWRLARFFGPRNGCKIAIEMNMDRGLTELLKLRGADLYHREIFNQRESKTTMALGFLTTVQTREMLIEALAGAIREWDTPGNGIDIFHPAALEELENFITKPSGRSEAADGFHDDQVLSIALGFHLIDHATPLPVETFVAPLPPDLRNAMPYQQRSKNEPPSWAS